MTRRLSTRFVLLSPGCRALALAALDGPEQLAGTAWALLGAPREAPPSMPPRTEWDAYAWAQRVAAWDRAKRFYATRARWAARRGR